MSTPVPTVEDGTLSPYVGTVMALIFNNNYVWVHSPLIRKFPNFAARFEDNQLKMKPIPQGAAHIVVHYLYTGSYEGLKALGTREVDKIKYHFKLAVHVYDLAREYNLYHLEDMATDELQCLAPKLQLGTIITVLDEQEFTHTKISSWLREYITGEVMRVRKSATTDAIRVMGDDMKHNRPITGIICETVARLGLENQRLRRSLEKRVAPLVTMSAFSSSSSQPTISGFPFLNTTNRYMSFWTLVSHYITSKCRPTPWYPLGESHQDGLLTHDPPSHCISEIFGHSEFAAQFENGEQLVDNVPPGAAHVVAHYIYTGQYSGLRVASPHGIDQTKHDFKIAVHVCALADMPCLPQLENLANQELMALTPNQRLRRGN